MPSRSFLVSIMIRTKWVTEKNFKVLSLILTEQMAPIESKTDSKLYFKSEV